MRSLLLISFLLIMYNCLGAQAKYDYNWLMGFNPTIADDPVSYRFDFNQTPFLIESNNGVRFDNQNASVSDSNGDLLFYTNGCSVLDATGNQMSNGDSLNYDEWVEIFSIPNCEFGYIGLQDILILEDPADEEAYFIIQKTKIYGGSGMNDKDSVLFAYSYVDMTLNDGLGDVVVKNQQFYEGDNLLRSYLTAIRHENKKDWWILQPVVEDSLILTFLLDENGISKTAENNSHQFFSTSYSGATGTAKFSPDGTKYALYNYYDNLHVYDFDRATGILTNHQYIEVSETDFSQIIFGSVEWSPNSDFLYVTSRFELHQIELLTNGYEIELIDVYNNTVDPTPITFHLMSQGPDCRIYMCSFGQAASYHVINSPDEKGVSCDFVQNQIQLPSWSGRASFPNFPRYRVDEESKCDSNLVSQTSEIKEDKKTIELFPNPTFGLVNIPENNLDFSSFEIRSISNNKLVESGDLISKDQREFDFQHLTAGIYIFILKDKDNRIFYSKMVIL